MYWPVAAPRKTRSRGPALGSISRTKRHCSIVPNPFGDTEFEGIHRAFGSCPRVNGSLDREEPRTELIPVSSQQKLLNGETFEPCSSVISAKLACANMLETDAQFWNRRWREPSLDLDGRSLAVDSLKLIRKRYGGPAAVCNSNVAENVVAENANLSDTSLHCEDADDVDSRISRIRRRLVRLGQTLRRLFYATARSNVDEIAQFSGR